MTDDLLRAFAYSTSQNTTAPMNGNSSEKRLITLDRTMLVAPLEIEVRRRKEDLGTETCARIAVEGAKCIICLSEITKNEHVVLFFCGHWVERICFNLLSVNGYRMQCPYKCKKEQQGFRSPDLMSAEYDVNEAELTDVEALLERDQELAVLEDARITSSRPYPTPTAHYASSSHMPAHPASHEEDDTPYDGDVEQGVFGSWWRENQPRRRRRRREMMERGLQELGGQEQSQLGSAKEGPQPDAEQEEPRESIQPGERRLGWFFDEAIIDDGDDGQEQSQLGMAQEGSQLDTEQQEPQQSRQPGERPPGWFFDEATRDEGDEGDEGGEGDEGDPYGVNSGLTLAQRMFNLPPGRRFL